MNAFKNIAITATIAIAQATDAATTTTMALDLKEGVESEDYLQNKMPVTTTTTTTTTATITTLTTPDIIRTISISNMNEATARSNFLEGNIDSHRSTTDSLQGIMKTLINSVTNTAMFNNNNNDDNNDNYDVNDMTKGFGQTFVSTAPSLASISSMIDDKITATTTTSSLASESLASASASASASATLAASIESSTLSETPIQIATDEIKLNVAEMSNSLQHFGWMDYFVFILMLAICAAIGFYFGFIEKKTKTQNNNIKDKERSNEQRRDSEALDYLVGGRKMKVLPVSLSLVASFVSGISLLGTSTEIYVYGTQYAFILITLAFSGVISWYVFLPVFCNLQLTSTYEYFEMRFGPPIRLFGSILYTLGTITWLPIVIYVPALAFNQVTGVNIHVVTPVVCLVCIFYTCVGGLKAVVWTDVIQTVIMLCILIFIIIKGTIDVGGPKLVWDRNYASGRIEVPDLTLDPTVRISMLSMFMGTTLYFVQACSTNQAAVQRYLALPSATHAKWACVFFMGGVILFYVCTFYNGLLIYAAYHDCDPLTTKLAKAKDQLVPLMVMETVRFLPGMSGLFVAGVFSAALSSLSTGLNSLAAVILEDYVKPLCSKPLNEFQIGLVMRGSVVIIGVLCVLLVFVVEYLGHAVLQLSMTLGSVTSGPLLGLFIMGLLIPWINTKSALAGTLISIIAMTWICIKGQMALANGELFYNEKPVTTEGCTYNFEPKLAINNTINLNDNNSRTPYQYIYHMSFTLYVTAGCVIAMISSGLSTFIFGYNKPSDLDIKLLAPCIRRFIKPQQYQAVYSNDKQIMITDNNTKQSSKDLVY